MPGFSINQVAVSGNLTRDPELKTFDSGAELAEFSIAVNERVKRGDEWEDDPSYFDVKFWKGTGKWITENLSKGDGLAVAGRLKQERWQDKDGNNRSKVVIVADSVMPRSGGGGGGGGSSSRSSAPADDAPPEPSGPPASSSAPPESDDIPFHHEEFFSYGERRDHPTRW